MQELFRGISAQSFYLGAREGEGPVPKTPVDDPGNVVHQGEESSGEFPMLPESTRLVEGHRDVPGDLLRGLDFVLRPFVGFRPVEKKCPGRVLPVAEGHSDEGPEAVRLEPLSPARDR